MAAASIRFSMVVEDYVLLSSTLLGTFESGGKMRRALQTNVDV